MAVRKNPIINTATTLGKLVGFLAVSVLCGVLVAGLMVPAVAVTGSAASTSIDAFDKLPGELTSADAAVATKILASDGSLIANLYTQNRQPVGFDQMSPFIKKAVVAIEDSRFYEHGGVDATGIMRALVSTVQGGRQGASTITQQYVNNKIIQGLEAQNKGDEAKIGAAKTVADKLREMKLAIALEKQQSKDEILAGYLNIVNFANGAYGIQAAAQRYFSVDASKLTLAQAAVLAGVVNSPSFYDPIAHPDNAKDRRDDVLDKMLAQKMITKKDHDAAVASPIVLKPKVQPQGCATAATAPFFCDYVKNLILSDPAYGKTADDRAQVLYQGGLTIKTTLDPVAQKAAQASVNATETAADIAQHNRAAAMVSVVPGTGKIVSMAQNFKMSPTAANGQTSYNFNVPRYDGDGKFLGGLGSMQVGSTMKPYTFASWLDADKSMNERVDGTQRSYPSTFPWKNSCGTTSSSYGDPGQILLPNDGNTNYRPMSVLDGLIRSVNTITFASAAQLDMCKIKEMAAAVGILDGGNGVDPATQIPYKKAMPLNFSQATELLGIDSVTPLSQANAFATFASGGTYCKPIAIDSITNGQGKKLPVPAADCKQTVKKEVANGVMFALRQVLSNSEGSGALIQPAVNRDNYQIGAKTGTTDFGVDTWVVGATSGLATASWFGNPTGNANDPAYRNQNITINGIRYEAGGPRGDTIDGAYVAGPAFSTFMNQIAPSYKHDDFPEPANNLVSQPYVAPPVNQNPNPNKSNPPSTGKATPPANNGGNNSSGNSTKKP